MAGKITGVTPVTNPTEEQLAALDGLGITKLRLINVTNADDKFAGDFVFSPYLDYCLELCQTYNKIPHIVIATTPPQWMEVPNTLLNPNDIESKEFYQHYYEYIKAHLNYVKSWGFTEVWYEVGNEMSSGKNMWLLPGYEGDDDNTIYNTYRDLYWWISKAFIEFASSNPGLDYKLGGCASYAASNLLWTFSQNAPKKPETYKVDFFSVHWYMTSGDIELISQRLNQLKQWYPDKPIIITEFGYNPMFATYPDACLSKTAWWWTQMVLDMADEWGIDEIYPLKVSGQDENDGYGLWLSDGVTPSPMGAAIIGATNEVG